MDAVQAAESLFWELDAGFERLQKPREDACARRDSMPENDPLRIIVEDTEITPLVDAAMALLEAMVAQDTILLQMRNARRANYLSYLDEHRPVRNCTDRKNRERL